MRKNSAKVRKNKICAKIAQILRKRFSHFVETLINHILYRFYFYYCMYHILYKMYPILFFLTCICLIIHNLLMYHNLFMFYILYLISTTVCILYSINFIIFSIFTLYVIHILMLQQLLTAITSKSNELPEYRYCNVSVFYLYQQS